MPISSFDVIIGMDWLSSHRAEILCHEKAIRLPLPNGEALIIYGDKSGKNLKVVTPQNHERWKRSGAEDVMYSFTTHKYRQTTSSIALNI